MIASQGGAILAVLVVFSVSASGQTKAPTTPWVRRVPNNQAAIVFVHGVLGDEKSTWNSGNSYWPEMLTHDSVFDGEDIYVYHYPSPILGRTLSIDEVADNMRLVLSTDGVLDHRELSFVAHSMGGIVTRAFILKYRWVVPKIRLLYFFATPTTGSPYAVLASIVSRNPQFGQLYPMQPDTYLAPLQSSWLAANLALKSYCAYETQPLFGQIIVDRASATNLCTQRLDPIDADHVTIVKPAGANSTSYRALKSAMQETARHGSEPAAAAREDRQAKAVPPARPTAGTVTAPTEGPIAALSDLGWNITSDENGVRTFGVAAKRLPDIKASAANFGELKFPFSLLLQNVPSIAGLSLLHDLRQLKGITIAGGEQIRDLVELRDFKWLEQLQVSATSTFDVSPLGGLLNLRELQLDQVPVSDIGPLATLHGLRKLTLGTIGAADVSAIGNMPDLRSLTISGSRSTLNLGFLSRLARLEELLLDGRLVPALRGVANEHLGTLHIQGGWGDQTGGLDLGALSGFAHLSRLDVYTSRPLNIQPLGKLQDLSDLEIMGMPASIAELNTLIPVAGLDVVRQLGGLRRLVLAHAVLPDLGFLSDTKLDSLQLNFSPLADLRIVGTLGSLTKLDIAGTGIVEITPLLNLPHLTTLGIQGTPARSDVVALLEKRGVVVRK
jgi:Leucine-rich repeat (LRR) protein/pimeloyl-ACP methyl ester carboxylesterase